MATGIASTAGIDGEVWRRLKAKFLHQQAVAAPSLPRGPGDVPLTHIPCGLDVDKHLSDAAIYGLSAARIYRAPVEPPLKTFSNAQLIHEMLERGFAVMKLPSDGGPPESIR